MKDIKIESICGKKVYIFEDHATALIPWAECRQQLDRAPKLFTLDFHTDVMAAFNAYECLQEFGEFGAPSGETADQLCAAIDYRDDGSVERAVEKLRNDEQIDAAIKAGIIDYAFVVSYDGRGLRASNAKPQKRFRIDAGEKQPNDMITLTLTEIEDPPNEASNNTTPEIPDDKMVVIDWEEGFEYPSIQITDDDTRRHSNLAIESEYLNAKLKVADEICRAIGQPDFINGKYILDIDLDYFRTEKSIAPENTQTFYELIRNAEIITVALEPKFVALERLSGEKITSNFLLSCLLEHIRKGA